ncbi:MAG: ribosome maturation factor RimP [Myxococcaceae bacterium]|nr:ribosome maturation factor RimP [Myxococcaceae bacterium]
MEAPPLKTIAEQTWALVAPILENEGYELIDVEFVREGGRHVLRLFIDKLGGSSPGNGVGIDDCERASNAVDSAIEVAELISHEYVLEVSSPGVERPLTRPAHFQRAIGQRVRVRLFRPLFTPPRKSLTGVLVAFENECVEVEVEGAGRFVIERKDIAKANLQPDWD